MRRDDKVAMTVMALVFLVGFPALAAWDLTHPERRGPNPGDDPHVYLPAWGVMYAALGAFGLYIYRTERKRKKRRARIEWLMTEINRLIADNRTPEAEVLFEELKALTGYKEPIR